MRHAATDTVPETLLGDATIREVLAIVTHDAPDQSPGMHAAIRGVLARRLGVKPSEEIVSLVAEAFWDACEESLGDG